MRQEARRIVPGHPALLAVLFCVCAVGVLGTLAGMLIIGNPARPTPPDDRMGAVGGMQYEAMLGRPIDPSDALDAPIVAGLPAGDRRLSPGQMLFGAFIAVANDSPRSLPPAHRIELRDAAGRVYAPLALPASNPYAYAPTPVPPMTRIPGFGTPADDNLAAGGKLVLFRITTGSYDAGPLELVIHDARNPQKRVDLVV